jgi:hypothetical protein
MLDVLATCRCRWAIWSTSSPCSARQDAEEQVAGPKSAADHAIRVAYISLLASRMIHFLNSSNAAMPELLAG